MKGFLILAAFLQGLAPVAQGHAGCGVVPDHLLEMIRDREDFDPVARQNANATLQLASAHRQSRMAADGQGITTDDDDDNFPDEQNPADDAELEEENDALEQADEQQSPEPDFEESRRRRRGLRVIRQGGQWPAPQGPARYIYDKSQNCNKKQPGQLVRDEMSSSANDDDINSVFDGLGAVWTLYSDVFGRDSIDNQGGKLHGQVHFCTDYNNAEWDGVQMLFGDGDGYSFTRGSFVRSIDVIGHEVTHGVVQHANPLYYQGQSGALNEHLADVFGILTKHYYYGNDVNSGSWLIGEGLLTKRIGGTGALRDMSSPGNAYPGDPQPSNMNKLFTGVKDQGGVHINSGIPNYAFFLFAQDIGGVAWDIPGQIWYNVLTKGQGNFGYITETFQEFADKTVNAADQLYNGTISGTLYSAWQKVGVLH